MAEAIYTVDDWKSGLIHEHLKKRELPQVILDEVKNVGFLNELLYRKKFILEKDYDEIKSIMKDVFFRVLDHNVQQRLDFFKPKLKEAYRPKQLLDERIKELQNTFDKADSHYREEALKGGWSEIGIDSETYKKINDEKYKSIPVSLIQFTPKRQFERLGGFHPHFTDKYYQMQNITFDVSEVFRFRERLIEFRSGKDISQINKYPAPFEIAKLFKDQSKVKRSDYSTEDYTFVMKYAMENDTQGNVSKLIRQITEAKNCPKVISKNKETNSNTLRRWIEFYDTKAGIKR
ncbi:hypothetical protein [Rhodohalobacter barkolensis]|uniref:Uncharacterized protein n=1 Tax=Rhodohalobacter barkolensis TaxID=2053187 RepID=A0A2N0VM69_9BACT|nr:hypothetical protein [Rhodohalobacter barkolensis]PKD45282.1 hypothetical protein CWD77_07520 [Rhodohalobacter barkolensis]